MSGRGFRSADLPGLGAFTWTFFAYLYAPIAILVVFSFNASRSATVWSGFSLQWYVRAFANDDIQRAALNSLVVAGSTTLITVLLAAGAAYGLARLRLPGVGWGLGLILAAGMFPQTSLAGPVWRILQGLGWLNTYQGLILPYVSLTLPLGVWVLYAFFRELPPELEEAALIDGCGRLQVLWRVVAPLAAPGVFTAAILVFIFAWNEFFFALLVMSDPARQTLPVGIALFQGEYTMPWGEIAAASTVATLPLVLMVLLFQRRIVRGLSAGAVKG